MKRGRSEVQEAREERKIEIEHVKINDIEAI